VSYGGSNYYNYGHSWYEPYWHGGHFSYYPIYPPAGYYYNTLPPKYVTVVINKNTYYESDGTYYKKGEKDGKEGYVVTEAPKEETGPVATSTTEAPDPFAILNASCEFMAGSRQFKFTTQEDVDEVMATGQKIQMSGNRVVAIQRPNRIAVKFEGTNMAALA